MNKIKSDSAPLKLIYFWIGIISAFSYRIIIVLNFVEPSWVKAAWYIGTVGFIFYFWSRYKAVSQFSSLIRDEKLVAAVKKAGNISPEQKVALSHIVKTLAATKAQINYVIIFILSGLALIAGIVFDFVI
jgi:hypothetical protein